MSTRHPRFQQTPLVSPIIAPVTVPAQQTAPLDQAHLIAALGDQRTVYRGDALHLLLEGIGALLGGAVLVLAAIALLLNGFLGGLLVLLLFSGALLVLLGPLLLYQAAHALGAWVTVYAHGMTLRRRGTVDVLRWDELAQLITYPLPHQVTAVSTIRRNRLRQRADSATFASPTPPTTVIRYVVVMRSGQRVSLLGYRRLPALAATIEHEIGARLYPQWVTNYRAGAPIPCGPWWIHRVGMTAGRLTLPWAALVDARIANALLRLTWRPLPPHPLEPPTTPVTPALAEAPVIWQAPLAQVPNVHLLLRLINDCRSGAL